MIKFNYLNFLCNRLQINIAVLLFLSIISSNLYSQINIPAFPGAEGWGKYTTGGRGGSVYIVTNLNNSGPGSLRDAVSLPNRIVVFRVSGTINLKSELVIKGNITIAGQTAPGDGICVKGYPTKIDGNNVIIRYMRFRLGDENNLKGSDALDINYDTNIVIDHCSISWGIDEVFSTYCNKNVTVQYCIVGEGLNYAGHSMGGLWGAYSTYHHNLIHTNGSRHPKYASIATNELADSRNNVIYNWNYQSAYTGEQGNLNLINNYYKPGPATQPNVLKRILQADEDVILYAEGNYVAGSPEVTINNWNGGIDSMENQKMPIRLSSPHPVPYDFPTQSAIDAYNEVIKHAGASYPQRDSVDLRIIKNVIDSTGFIINRQSEVGGWPLLFSAPAPKDSDNDGMPDHWEISHGLNPYDPSDANNDFNGDGYSNIEKYINSIINYPYATTYYIKSYENYKVIYPQNDSIKIKNFTKNDSLSIWLLIPTTDGFYSITNLKTGLSLEVKNGSTQENEIIVQNSYIGNDYQQWEVINIDSFIVIRNKKSQMVLDLISFNNDTVLVQKPFTGKKSQKFIFHRFFNDNIPPKVLLTTPKTGNLYNAGDNITIEAQASDDQAINKIEFYANGNLIATCTEEPFSITWNNVPEGIYTISALAYDENGSIGTSTEETIVVMNLNSPEGKVSFIIQENETGFCGADGAIESEHVGYSGKGYVNTTNATGKGINWKIYNENYQILKFEWRHANGSSSRPAKLIINGNTLIPTINFPNTGAWTNYQIVSAEANVEPGLLDIRLEANGSGGLSNIDFIKITGNSIKKATCSGEIIDKIYEYQPLNNIQVYPSPLDNNIQVSITDCLRLPVYLKIFDINGKIIYQNKYDKEGNFSISTINFPKSLIFVYLQYQNKIDVRKIILK